MRTITWFVSFILLACTACISNLVPQLPQTSTTHLNEFVSPHATDDDFVRSQNGSLILKGEPYRFVGVNIYSLLSHDGKSKRFVCGKSFTEAAALRTVDEVAEMGANVIRVQAYQSYLRDKRDPTKLDFTRLDAIIARAKSKGIRLVVTLENQWWDCSEGGYKWSSWYAKKYRAPYGRYRLSFRDFAMQVASRYKDEPTILMWQLINEAESKMVGDTEDPAALLQFAKDMAKAMKQADPNHILSLGTIGLARQGSGGPFFTLLHQVAGIDIVEAHDYHDEHQALPPNTRIAMLMAKEINKPFFVGEVGIKTPTFTHEEQAQLIGNKLEAAWEAGISGVIIWTYGSQDGHGFDFGPKDPLYERVKYFTRHYLAQDGE